ncbi:hypothetical protein [Chroogloeocystis siderophila]
MTLTETSKEAVVKAFHRFQKCTRISD